VRTKPEPRNSLLRVTLQSQCGKKSINLSARRRLAWVDATFLARKTDRRSWPIGTLDVELMFTSFKFRAHRRQPLLHPLSSFAPYH
jgi:hypothetical protein